MSDATPQLEDAVQRLAVACVDLIAGMMQARIEIAAEHGFTLTDDELADSIKDSIMRMALERHGIGGAA